MATKARFFIKAEASTNVKTTVHNVKYLQLEGSEEIFAFPQDEQLLSTHSVLAANPIIKTARKALSTRNSYRNPYVILTPEIMETYLDAAGNPYYKGALLEEIDFHPKRPSFVSYSYLSGLSSSTPQVTQPVMQTVELRKKSLLSIAKDVVLEKFDGSNWNPFTWMDNFESECQRLEVHQERNCEIL